MAHNMQADYEQAKHLNMKYCFKISNCKILGLGVDMRLNVIDKSNKINVDIKVLQKICVSLASQ